MLQNVSRGILLLLLSVLTLRHGYARENAATGGMVMPGKKLQPVAFEYGIHG